MNTRIVDYLYIFFTIGFTVYGQLVLKWRINLHGSFPITGWEKCKYLMNAIFDPWIFSGLAAGFLASIMWMAAMTKFDLNQAYPFISLNFVLVLVFSFLLLSEQISLSKILGMFLIIVGTIIATRG